MYLVGLHIHALNVSGYISPSSGATFYKLYIVFGIFGYDIQLIKVALHDGLIQSEKCRASNEKIKFNHRNLCLLFYIYCSPSVLIQARGAKNKWI